MVVLQIKFFSRQRHIYLALLASCHRTVCEYTFSPRSSPSHRTSAVATHNHNLRDTVDVEGEASRCAMEAADEIKEGGAEMMPTAIPNPPETGGVEAMRTGKGNPPWNAGTVARKATGRASAGRSCRLGKNRVRKRFRTYRQGKSAAIALRRRIRESRKRVSLRDETRSKLNEADHPEIDEVWYVDSGASNHMTSHKEWFSYLEKPMQPGLVATEDDTPHPIANVGEVPLSHVGQKGKLITHQRVAHSDNHEEPGLGRTDRRPRNGGPVYTPRVLH